MIHLSDNSCWSSREAMSQSETSGSKCLILTQQMINGSTGIKSLLLVFFEIKNSF
jgi:hypothetical protein